MGNLERILDKLTDIATELEKDMDQNGWTGRTVTLKFKLDTYQGITSLVTSANALSDLPSVFTRAKSIDHWVSKKEELFAVVFHFVWVHSIFNILLDW